MAPALSALIKPEKGVTWQGDDVSLGEVLKELDGLRKKFARAEAQDVEHPHPRNCVMTLVAVGASDAEERRAQEATRKIGSLHPAQIVVIRDQPSLRPGRIDATITTDVLRPKSACAMQCEVVTLRVRGAAGEHLAALVDPLLMSGVPTYLWWVGTPPFGKKELENALGICDALIVDSARFDAPYHSFLQLAELGSRAHHKLGVGDMQWARLEPWLETVAQFFAPMARRPFLSGISEIGVDYAGEGRANRVAPAMLIGWIASALGWKLQRAAGGTGGIVVARYTAEGWRPVRVAFRSVTKSRLASGEVSALRIGGAAGGSSFQLTVLRDPERARRVSPDVGAGAYQSLHVAGGGDDAGLELAQRRAEWHRDVLNENAASLHHTATGDPPGESVPAKPAIFVHDRRRQDNSQVLVTLIDIGGAPTLRHVQQIDPEDEASLLMGLLAHPSQDHVFGRSLVAAAELMRSI
ncbi:MAG: hypothetical protein NVS1B3_09750 [Candidatus Dormibacteraceae bacterium]